MGPGLSHKGTDFWRPVASPANSGPRSPWPPGGVLIPASWSLPSFPTQLHPLEFMPALGHLLGIEPHTLSCLTWGELVSCPPDLGMLVDHFALGPAHLVCASVCVCVYCLCHLCTPHSLEYTRGHTTVGTSRMQYLWTAA